MTTTILPAETTAKTGFTHMITLTHEDLTEATANTAQTIPILDVGIGDMVTNCATYVDTYFTDASDAAFNTTAVTVGDGGSANRFLASQELNSNGTEVKTKATALTAPYVYTAADTIDIVFNSMALKSLVDIDAGQVRVFLAVASIAKLVTNAT